MPAGMPKQPFHWKVYPEKGDMQAGKEKQQKNRKETNIKYYKILGEEEKMKRKNSWLERRTHEIKIGEFANDQERRQALVDCTDIMFTEMSKAAQGSMERFLLVKTLHNEIVAQMSGRDRD